MALPERESADDLAAMEEAARRLEDLLHRAQRAGHADRIQRRPPQFGPECAEALRCMRFFVENAKNERQREQQRRLDVIRLSSGIAILSVHYQDHPQLNSLRKYAAFNLRNLTCGMFNYKIQLANNRDFMQAVDMFIRTQVVLIKPYCDVLVNLTYYSPDQPHPDRLTIQSLANMLSPVMDAISRVSRDRCRPSSLHSLSSNGSSTTEEYDRAFSAAFNALWNILLLDQRARRKVAADNSFVQLLVENLTPEKCKTQVGRPLTAVVEMICEPPYIQAIPPRTTRRLHSALASLVEARQSHDITENVLQAIFFSIQNSLEPEKVVKIYVKKAEQLETELQAIGRSMRMTVDVKHHWNYLWDYIQRIKFGVGGFANDAVCAESRDSSTLFDSPSPSSSEEPVDFTPPSPNSAHAAPSPKRHQHYLSQQPGPSAAFEQRTPLLSAKTSRGPLRRLRPSPKMGVPSLEAGISRRGLQRQPMGTKALADQLYTRPNKDSAVRGLRHTPHLRPVPFQSSDTTASLSGSEFLANARHARVMQITDTSFGPTSSSSLFDDSALSNMYENHPYQRASTTEPESSDSNMVHTTSSSSNDSASTQINNTLRSNLNSTLRQAHLDSSQDNFAFYENEEVILSAKAQQQMDVAGIVKLEENKENELDTTHYMDTSFDDFRPDLNESMMIDGSSVQPSISSFSLKSMNGEMDWKENEISPKSEANFSVKEEDIPNSPSELMGLASNSSLAKTSGNSQDNETISTPRAIPNLTASTHPQPQMSNFADSSAPLLQFPDV